MGGWKKKKHCRLYQMFKFDHSVKWYIHNPEYVLGIESLKMFWDFEIQSYQQISARRQDLMIANKKKKKKKKKEDELYSELYHPGRSQGKTEWKQKREKYLDLTRDMKRKIRYGIWKWKWRQSWFVWTVIIIIIIMLCRSHGYPWPSLATSPNHSSPLANSTVTKILVQGLDDLEIREQLETTVLLSPSRLMRKIQVTWGDLLSLKLLWNAISLRRCENF